MVPIIASYRRRLLQFPLSHCCLIFMNFSFNFQNRKCTETLLHCEVHEFSFPTSPHSPKIDSEQESNVNFVPALQSVPTNFRTCNVQCSCHISLYGSSNSLILDASEQKFLRASEYQLFSSLYVSVHVQNLMKTAELALELWRCWRIWFLLWSRIHGNTLSCLQNNSSAQSTPRWQSGVETIANKPTIPKISICGIASLAKKIKT